MNARLKRLAETALVRSGVARAARARLPDQSVLILAYHDIVPTGERNAGDSSLHLPQRDFARHLDLICATHDIVPLDTALTESVTGTRPRVVVTFDDAYAGALSAGTEELERRQLPAVVFVAPALLGQVTWWDVLATTADGGVRSSIRQHALWQLAGKQERILDCAGKAVDTYGGHASPRIGTVAELESAVKYCRLTVAAHTWSHPNLCALTSDELMRELVLSLEWITSRFPKTLPMISYPYGLLSHDVELAASLAGYTRGFRVDGGWITDLSRARPFAMPRFNVAAGISLDGLRLRLAGIGASS